MAHDVRMRGFKERAEVDDVVRLLDQRVQSLPLEEKQLWAAAGRILATDVTSTVDVPHFHRSAMDGYALRGSETFGATAYNPLEFVVVGQALPGQEFSGSVAPGQAVRIMTGAPIPDGLDAVLQAEFAEEVQDGAATRVRITEPVPPGRHVGRIGEDVTAGTVVLHAGRQLRPQDLGVLASIGIDRIHVFRLPKVAILITGNELLPCGSKPAGFRIVDSNSIMLAALAQRDGASVLPPQLLTDSHDAIRDAVRSCLAAGADIVLLSGGSSVGQEDHSPRVVAEMGELPIHGVALRPASPAGVGFIDGHAVFLMPGNPVSCLCAYDLFAGRAIRRLGGLPMALPYRTAILPLARKMTSVAGRVDYVRVTVQDGKVEPIATSGASILSSTTRADGFVLVPRDSEGYPAGERVEVHFYG